MPLREDGIERGGHATHVRRHSKLGKHRTITNAALPLVNRIIDWPEVRHVDLGLVVRTQGKRIAERRIRIVQTENVLRCLFVGGGGAQLITVQTKRADFAMSLSVYLQELWENPDLPRPAQA